MMNKQTVLDFIKKYPMSILLAIIAINLFSIGGSLNTEKELNKQKLICIKYKKGFIKVFDLDKKLNMPNLNSRKIPTTATDACNAILAS